MLTERGDLERIAAVDAANLELDHGQPNVVTLAGLLAPGGFVDAHGAPDLEAFERVIAPRVGSIPALNRTPDDIDGVWMWREVELDLTRHVRVIDPEPVARPGDAAGAFERTCARVVMEHLPPGQPPWEILLVPHADGNTCGLLFRLHHAVADGMAMESLVAAVADPAPSGEATAEAPPVRPELTPPATRSLPRRVADSATQVAAVFRRTVHSRVLLGPLGPTRDVAFLDVDLQALHVGARRLGGTVDDAFLATFGHGIGALLAAAGEDPPSTLPVSCPVGLGRRPGEGNATGMMLVRVPVAGAEPVSCMAESVATVAAATRTEKLRARAVGTFRPMRSPRAARMLMRFARRQRAVGAIASELTGPSRPLFLAGAELVAAWPLALLSGNVRVGAVAVSYAGRFRVSLQTDAANLPPARVLAESMSASLEWIARGGLDE